MRATILMAALLVSALTPSAAQTRPRFNGEGGSLPGGKDSWRTWTANVTMSPRPDAATRAKELGDRKQAIQAEIARLKERLKRTPTAAQQAAIDKQLDELFEMFGLAPSIPRVMSRGDIDMIRKRQSEIPKGFLDGWIQFKKDLDARGVDLILMPVAPDSAIYMHQLVPGLTPQTEVWPGWTQMMLQLLENDIEIIDTVDAFRAETANPISVIFPNDGHTGSRGRQIMGKALAERLQRYDFARALAPNRSKFTYTTKTHPGNDIFGGTLYFSKCWEPLKAFDGQENPSVPGRTLFSRPTGPAKALQWFALRNEAMVPGLKKLKETPFDYLEVKARFARGDECSNLDMVFFGDSQLHTAVHGSGLPAIVGAEVGGVFRWTSKSWSGFEGPEIYLRGVMQDKDENHPRVAVCWFLPFKFQQKEKEEYKPRPLPPYPPVAAGSVNATSNTTTAAPALSTAPFAAAIRITAVSKQRDPNAVEYKEALAHNAAVIVGGPYDGRVIGVRYWTMFDAKLIAAAGKVKPGDTFTVTLQPWALATRLNIGGISQHMVYNDTDQDTLTTPLFWITQGDLAPDRLLPRR